MPRKSDPDKPKPPRKTRAPRKKKLQQAELNFDGAAEAPSVDVEEAETPRRRPFWLRIILFSFVIFMMTLSGGFIAGYKYVMSWSGKPYGAATKSVEFKIAPGTSFMDTSNQLATQGIVSDRNLFRAFAVIERKEGSLQAGVYRIKLPVTPGELLAQLQKGTFQGRITIPEGWTSRQIDEYLFENNWISEQGRWIALSAQPLETTPLGEPLPQGCEGFCFPDTYMLDEGTSPEKIRDKMLARFSAVWNELNPASRDPRAEKLTLNEVVTLASIVERETRKPEELPRIASVFLNRLEKRMKLQSCATVHYALGEVWNRKLTYDDLKLESAFNTYQNSGLPPSPIGSPGRSAIEAVLRPAQGDDLYFVHRGDGTHEFTKTYREHQKAANKFRRSDPNAGLVAEK